MLGSRPFTSVGCAAWVHCVKEWVFGELGGKWPMAASRNELVEVAWLCF